MGTKKHARNCLIFIALVAGGCANGVNNAPGTPTNYQDPGTRGIVSGVGIESQDIIGMTDEMVRDMLTVPQLAGRATPPRVIVDGAAFRNESTQRINKNIIVDRLRVGLQRAAGGRLVFVGREYANIVEQERQLKRDGTVDVATTGLTKAQAGSDFRLGGRISSLDAQDPSTGVKQRYNQIIFEMIDLESGIIAWSGIYEFSKAGQEDAVYR